MSDRQPDKLQDNLPDSADTAVSDKQSDNPQDNSSAFKDTAKPNTQLDVSENEYAIALPGLDVKNKKIK